MKQVVIISIASIAGVVSAICEGDQKPLALEIRIPIQSALTWGSYGIVTGPGVGFLVGALHGTLPSVSRAMREAISPDATCNNQEVVQLLRRSVDGAYTSARQGFRYGVRLGLGAGVAWAMLEPAATYDKSAIQQIALTGAKGALLGLGMGNYYSLLDVSKCPLYALQHGISCTLRGGLLGVCVGVAWKVYQVIPSSPKKA